MLVLRSGVIDAMMKLKSTGTRREKHARFIGLAFFISLTFWLELLSSENL